MSNQRYQILFRGDIADGQSLPDVKQRLKKLFKVDDARIESLFSGKPIPLKRNLGQEQAQHYHKVLRQVGALVTITEMDDEPHTHSPKPQQKTVKKDSQPNIQEKKAQWGLAPAGSQLSELRSVTLREVKTDHLNISPPEGNLIKDTERESQVSSVIDLNTDHLDVSPQEGNLVKDSEKEAPPEAVVDADHLGWDLSVDGEDLLKNEEKRTVDDQEVDIFNLSLAEQSGNIIKDSERPLVEAVEVDISALALVDNSDEKAPRGEP